MKEVLSIKETADMLGTKSTRKILYLLSEGTLKEVKDGNNYVGVEKASVLEYKRGNSQEDGHWE